MSDEIDDLINSIEIEEDDDSDESKEITLTDQKKELETAPDATEEEELMQAVVDMTLDDRKKADDLYNVFLPEVSLGKDRSTASKEAMSKAVELKIAAAKNIIELIKIKKGPDKNNVGVFFGNTLSSKKAGVDINKIKDSI